MPATGSRQSLTSQRILRLPEHRIEKCLKKLSGPTWALLSPNKLPDTSEAEKILGAIVPDYENPIQNDSGELRYAFQRRIVHELDRYVV